MVTLVVVTRLVNTDVGPGTVWIDVGPGTV